MKLLIITQKVDATDSNLGFFVRWIEEFAKHCEHVTVIANEVGAYDLAQNVTVLSLGKETGASRLLRVFRYRKMLWKTLPNVDGIFFHMCPEYVLAAKFLPKLFGKKSVLWYTHKEVSLRLRVASWLVNRIFTASKESCRLRSKKVEVVGHGIDTETRIHTNKDTNLHEYKTGPRNPEQLRLVTVGRIAPVKDLRTLIAAWREVRKQFPQAALAIIGEPITAEDMLYKETLQKEFSEVEWKGSMPYGTVYTQDSYSAFVHASQTGSMDKAVLEALAAGLPVFTSSEAWSEEIPGITKFEGGNPHDLAEKIQRAFSGGKLVIATGGRAYVEEHHSLKRLIPRILASLSK